MTKLGIVAKGDKQAVLRAIDLLNQVDGLTVIYVTQNENTNLYIVNEIDFYRLKQGMHNNDRD